MSDNSTAPALKRHRLRFSLRMMFVGLTVCSLAAYQLDWVRQRHALLAESALVDRIYQNNAGATMHTLPPLGATFKQRFFEFFGEPAIPQLKVFYIHDEKNEVIKYEDGSIGVLPTEDFPKIRHARELFPEAEIIADAVFRPWINGPDAQFRKLDGLISE